MFPFFLLSINKSDDYHIYNPVDNHGYTVNYWGYRILEYCDGNHSSHEIAQILAPDFMITENEAQDYISSFLEDMTKWGMLSWRNQIIDPISIEKPPETVFWDITALCNQQCIHCYYNEKITALPELSTDQCKRLVDELAFYGVTNLVFSGGELFLREDIMEILNYAADYDFPDLSISTNGTLINPKIAKELKNCNVNIQVSIDGDTASLHDQVRGVDGSFENAIQGIKLLQKENVPVSVCTVATNMNVKRIPAIIELMNHINLENYRVQGLMPIGRGMTNDKIKLTPTRMKQLVQYLESRSIPVSSYNFTLQDPTSYPVDMNGSGACAAATSSCSITPGGNVLPCVHFWGLKADNVRDHTFRWIWENSSILRYFRYISLKEVKGFCRDCNWLSACHGGCKAENYLTGDIFGSNYTCWVADAHWRSNSGKKI